MSEPLPAEIVAQPALFVTEERRDPGVDGLRERFGEVVRLGTVTRTVRGVTLEHLLIYRVAAPHGGEPRDPVYPLP